MRALVADSDPDRLRQVEGWLTKWGHDVASVRNGLEAWSRLEAERSPILVVLAWRMEGLHGIDVCRKLRLQPELPSAYVLLRRGRPRAGGPARRPERRRRRLRVRADRRRRAQGAHPDGRADRRGRAGSAGLAGRPARPVHARRDHRSVEPGRDPRPPAQGAGARSAQERLGRRRHGGPRRLPQGQRVARDSRRRRGAARGGPAHELDPAALRRRGPLRRRGVPDRAARVRRARRADRRRAYPRVLREAAGSHLRRPRAGHPVARRRGGGRRGAPRTAARCCARPTPP